MCTFKPTFIAAIEHSDEDLQALLDKLGEHNAIAATLTAAQFHANPSKPAASAGAPAARALKSSANYTELYPPGVKEVFDRVFKSDFAAFGYAKDPACV
jgi:hypothetical protein